MYTITLCLLALFSLYISVFALVRWDASWLWALNCVPVQVLFILAIAVLLGVFLLWACRLLHRQSEGRLLRFSLLCLLLLLAGQLLFLFIIRPEPRYDPLKVFDMAVEMLRTHTISGTYETGYFARYTNNYPITILTYWILRVLSSLGAPQSSWMLICQLLNVLCITLSIALGFLLLRELTSLRTAALYLLICVICPLSYVWAGYYYTATLSMPCLMGILWIALRIRRASTTRGRILFSLLLGFITILGYKLRATAAIALIAVVIAVFCQLWQRRRTLSPGWLRQLARVCLMPCLAFLLTTALSLGFWSSAVDTYVAFDYQNTGFPAIHWVMMSARWDGEFNQSDENYTASFATKGEKTAADLAVLKERITEAGPLGLMTLAGRKLLNTWADGTDSYQAENSNSAYGRLYDLLLGDQSGFVTIYAQAFRCLQMLAIGLGACAGLWQLRRRKKRPAVFLIQLTLLGGMAFHLIWETNPLYSIGFTFLGLMLLAESVSRVIETAAAPVAVTSPENAAVPEAVAPSETAVTANIAASASMKKSARETTNSPLRTDSIHSESSHKGSICASQLLSRSWLSGLAALLTLLILLSLSKSQLVDTPIEARTYCVNQYQYAGGNDGIVTSYDQVYAQTFTTDQPFNRIRIQANNAVGNYNQSAFTVLLTDEEGNILYDNDRFLSGQVDGTTPYEFELGEICPDGPTTYTLTITPGYIHGEDSLEFYSYTTGNWDLYGGGILSIGGEEIENGDLAFAVYEYKVTTYFSLKQYVVLCVGILGFSAAVTLGARRSFPKPRKESKISS